MIAVPGEIRRPRDHVLGGIAAAVALVAVLVAPVAAQAAPGGVEVSDDGVTFTTNYTGELFDSLSLLVPGDQLQESIYLRNTGSEAGHLRITLRDVVAADADFADALTVSASTVGQAGPAATLLLANPCWVLLEDVTLAPGQTITVDTAVALGNLNGNAGQGAAGQFSLGVALTSTAVSLPSTQCGVTNVVVPGTPQLPVQRSGSSPGTSGLSGEIDPGSPPAAEEPEDLPVLNLPELLGIDPNTWRLFEEYFVFLLIGAFIVGGAWFAFIGWRRRHNEDDPETEEGALG